MPILKLQGQRVNYDIETFIGRPGTIFYGPDDGSFRLSDGQTPGGIALSTGSGDGSGYVLPTATASVKGGVKIDGSTIQISNQVISVLNGVFTTGSYSNPSWITSLAYDKITGAPTVPTNTNQLTNGAGFITSSSLSGLATESYVTTRGYLTDVPEASASTKGGIKLGRGLTKDANGVVDAFSGSYNDLTDKPTIPTDINQLSDASGLLSGGGGSGSDGLGISNVAVNESGRLIITYTDNTTVDAGYVVGPQGETGPQGIQGIQGETGPQGIQGIQGIQGETGPAGSDGADGLSAYEIAVSNGFSGTEAEWLTSLIGPQGETGAQGIQGESGAAGADGSSAYEIAVTNGFSGNEAAWLASLVGPQGEQGIQGIQGETGPQGDPGTNGIDGVGVATASIDESGNLIITLTDTSTINTGNVYANTGNITFATTTIDTSDSSGITFTPSVSFNSDLTVENDLIVRNQIRTVSGDIFATESFVQQAVNELIGAAPEALNTLQELAAALGNDDNFATTILNALSTVSSTVRYDINNQGLTEQQQQNARTNIGAISEADMYVAAIIM